MTNLKKQDYPKDIINNKKKCFIITPVGEENSEIRIETQGIIEAVIKPTLENDYEIIAAHLSLASVQITKEIIQSINSADLIIANLTGSNPNVMYELSLAHALRKPVVHIIREGEKPSFDISVQRYICYTNNMLGTVKLKNSLESFVKVVIKEGTNISNPITDSIDNITVKSKDRDINFVEAFERINKRLDMIERNFKRSQTLEEINKMKIHNLDGFMDSYDFMHTAETRDMYRNFLRIIRSNNFTREQMQTKLFVEDIVKIIDLDKNIAIKFIQKYLNDTEGYEL